MLRFALVMAILLTTGWVRAQDENAAAAEVLFREARALFDAGRAEQACPKFAASYKLSPGLGTLTNLARCYETINKTASAWALWVDLESLATRAHQPDRVKIAKEHIAALEPKLVWLTIVVPDPHALAGLEVVRGDTRVAPTLFGIAVAVDPGSHRIVAKAPGHASWTHDVSLGSASPSVTLEVPLLVRLAAPAAPVPAPAVPLKEAPPPAIASDDAPLSMLLLVGGVIGGVGLVGWAVAGGLSTSAASDWSAADCRDGICPTEERQALSESANQSADLATGFVIGGGALVAVGMTFILLGALGDDAGDDNLEVVDGGLMLRF